VRESDAVTRPAWEVALTAAPSPAARAAAGVFLALAVGVAAPGATQERADTTRRDSVITLPNLVVRAATPVTTVGGASGVRASLDSLPLPAAPSLEEVLRDIPLLHVRRNSRGEAEVSVRGSESRQVAVLVDGVPLTLAWDARADVSVIPATAAREVNFVRGLSSMLYGPNVLGGIVELSVGQTFYQPPSPSAEVAAELDHVGGYAARASVSLPVNANAGGWLVRAGASHRDSPGFPLPGGVVEPVPVARELRLNTDATNVDGFLAVRYHDYGGAWFSASGASFRAARGIAAELGVADGARFWRYPHVSRTVMVASGGTGDRRTPLGRGDLEASIGVDLGRTDIDAYTDRTYRTLDGFENGEDRTLTARVLGDHTLGPRGDLRAAFTLSDIRHDEFLPDAEARYRQRLWSVGTETVWRVVEHGGVVRFLQVSAGGAWDVAETPETGGREALGTLHQWGGRLGATVGLAGGGTLLHGGISRRGRFPALRELYSGALNRFAPNPDLQPEHLLAVEAGVTTRIGVAEVQAVGFRHQLNDAVVRITLPDRRFMRVNRNRLTSTGAELLVSLVVGRAVFGGDLTLQSVDLTDTDAGVTHRPENLPEVFGSVHASVTLPAAFHASAKARFTGSQYCIDPGTGQDARLAPGTVVNAEVGRTWWNARDAGWLSRFDTRIAVDNVGNVTLYDQCGLPRAGRLVRLQFRVF
jgi:iron complex outermembrane receptor protein